jgi:putative FmdB family regulatory protein
MTYEYKCKACGHLWEAQQKITEEPLKECPSCKKPEAQRLISGGTGTVFKGAGWYATGGY